MRIFGYILTYAPLSIVPPLLIGLVRYRLMSVSFRLLCWYVFTGCLVQGLSYLYWYNNLNNLPLLHVYTILEFGFIALFYGLEFRRTWLLTWLALGFAQIAILNTIFLQPLHTYNSYARSLEAIMVLVCVLLSLYRQLLAGGQKLRHQPLFWVNLAFLFYFSGSLFLFIAGNYLLSGSATLNQLVWGLHALWVWLLYTLIAIGLWKHTNR